MPQSNSSSDIRSDKDDVDGKNETSLSPEQMTVVNDDSTQNQVNFSPSVSFQVQCVYKHSDNTTVDFILLCFIECDAER